MPIDALPASLPAVEAEPTWPEGTGALRKAHGQTAQLLGVPGMAVTLHLRDGRLPAGLSHLLRRVQPDWFPSRPLWRVLRPALQQQDTAALTALAAQGWLTHAPRLWLAPEGEAAETDILADLQAATTITAATDPTAALRTTLAWPAHTDPVMVRWLVLFHEAAHTERGELTTAPLQGHGWSAERTAAFNALVWEGGDFMGDVRDTFDESFADAYGALLLLRVTGNAPAARQAVAYLADFRQTEQARRPANAVDGHGAGWALRQVLADTASAPDAAWLMAARPEGLRHAAQAWGGEAALHLLATPSDRERRLGWAHTAPTDPRVDDRAVMRIEAYVRQRLNSYAVAEWGDARVARGAVRDAGQSLLLRAVAQADGALRADFEAQVPKASRQALTAFMAAHTPPSGLVGAGGPSPLQSDPAFSDWVDRTTQRLVDEHRALVVADQQRLNGLAQALERSLTPAGPNPGRRRAPSP
jgi:hypothetical protein